MAETCGAGRKLELEGEGEGVGIAVLPFFDCHFHIWDCQQLHEQSILAEPALTFPEYTLSLYEEHLQLGARHGIRFVGGVFVEALPANENGLGELKWVASEIQRRHDARTTVSPSWLQRVVRSESESAPPAFELVGRINLTHETAEQTLRGYHEMGVRGVRQILNYEPSWPHVTHNYLEDQVWLNRFRDWIASGKYGIRLFELHCNPHQLQRAASLVADSPETTFVLNHLGCKRAADSLAAWRGGLELVARHPNALLKLSHPCYTDSAGWWKPDSEVVDIVKAAAALFGEDRVMIASNYPVSHADGCEPQAWFEWLCSVVRPLLGEVAFRKALFDNAVRVYGAETS